MDCDACNNLLLDYLYEELDEVRAAAMREHLRGCASCAEPFERLTLGRRAARSLPVLEAPAPSVSLIAAIHAATPAAKLRLVSGSSVAVEPAEGANGRFPRWLQRVGEVAMRRQVAMAAVFLLMIGFGLSYNQFQAPTRPLPSSDDPGGMVIPAREVPTPPPPGGAPARAADLRRTFARGGTVERSAEHRVAPTPRPSTTALDELPAPAQASQQVAQGAARAPDNTSGTANAERDDNTVNGLPTAYRDQPAAAPPAVGSAVTSEQVSGDPSFDRGMPRLQVPQPNNVAQQNDAAQQNNAIQQSVGGAAQAQQGNALEQQALNRGRAPYGAGGTAEGWQGLQQQGDTHHAQGQTDQAVDAWRRALTADPPTAERTTIARRLYNALLRSGRQREASEVYAMYLMRANNTTELGSQVPSTPTSSVQRPAVSRPMPSSRAPVRRSRQAPSATDAYSNVGL